MEAFVRLQKCGSQSMKDSCQGNLHMLNHGYCYDIKKKITGDIWLNLPIWDKDKYEKLYALVRNPFDALKSYYFHNHSIKHKLTAKNKAQFPVDYNRIDGWCFVNQIHEFNSWWDFLDSYIDPNFEWHLPPMKKSLYSFAYDKDFNLVIDRFFKLEEKDELNKFLKSKGMRNLGYNKATVTQKVEKYNRYYKPHHVDALNKIWDRDLEYFEYSYNEKI
tara:strand:- start:1973 stop:2626 length:654 start_codon:yes stop_codon:yes gene_type:complete